MCVYVQWVRERGKSSELYVKQENKKKSSVENDVL